MYQWLVRMQADYTVNLSPHGLLGGSHIVPESSKSRLDYL